MQIQQLKKTLKSSLVLCLSLSLIANAQGNQVFEEPKPSGTYKHLTDIPFYNPYEVFVMTNDESSIVGRLGTQVGYNSEQHQRSLDYLHKSLKAPHDYAIDPRKIPTGINNHFVSNLSFSFSMSDYKRAYLIITDGDDERFSIPDQVVQKPWQNPDMKLEMLELEVVSRPFSFQFSDVRDRKNIYLTTNESNLVVMDKFLQMDFELPSQMLFGFGERNREFRLGEGTWTMWARDPLNNTYDDGQGGKQSYGVHPFIMIQGMNQGDYFGMFFRNANAQSPLLKYNLNGGTTLSYITTGGQLEIEFYIHGTPKQVIQQYLQTIGYPQLPPFWSLGWGQSSYAYQSLDQVKDMMEGYKDAKIPLEVVWLDIPYMEKFEDFSVDKAKFPDLDKFTDSIHDAHYKLVVIMDPAISRENKYYLYAQEQKAFIKSVINEHRFDGALAAQLFKKDMLFFDWFSPNVGNVLLQGISELYNLTHFDGLWLDMNENTIYCDGECPSEEFQEQLTFISRKLKQIQEEEDTTWFHSFVDQSQQSTYLLPFIPGFENEGNLDHLSLSLNATHANKQTEYNLHSLNGHYQSRIIHNILKNLRDTPISGTRPFILSRSTFSGSGQFASHWLGDNWRDWDSLKRSISGIMNMNMFGVPHTGADICGFFGQDVDSELCARWIQLAQFYPFARIHYNQTFNGATAKGTEPYNLEQPWQEMARASIFARYQYLRLMYTCLFEASTDGNTCFDPLFYYYPFDTEALNHMDDTFMFAGALKVSPILEAGVTDYYQSYFPKGRWVSMRDWSEVVEGPGMVDLRAHSTVNVHLRPGSIIPFQDNSDLSINKTFALQEKPISIIVNRDQNRYAEGSIFLDKGISQKELDAGQYEYYKIKAQAKSVQFLISKGNRGSQNQYLHEVVFVDAEDLKDIDVACYWTYGLVNVRMETEYDSVAKTLSVRVADEEHVSFSQIRMIQLGSTTDSTPQLCTITPYYDIKGGQLPDLTQSQVSLTLEHRGDNLPDLNITFSVLETNMVNIKWTVSETPSSWKSDLFAVPEEIIATKPVKKNQQLKNFISISDKPFGFKVIARDGTVLSDHYQFYLDEYFNYESLELNTTKEDKFRGIMGLGERVQDELFYQDGVYSLWAKDAGMPFDDGQAPGKNVYGMHPFFMYQNSDNLWVGAFVKLANAQDWYIQNNKHQGKVSLTKLAAGGLGDITYIVDKNPNLVSAAYLTIVGKPTMVPQWALGWHQCRWGYKTLDDVKEVVQKYKDFDLPLDVQWSDIDYMFNYRDFTYDHKRYQGLSEFVDDLHANGMRYVPILDAAISQRSPGTFPVYDQGVYENVFIKVNDDQILTCQVWPKDAVYVDWWAHNASKWWQNELTIFSMSLKFDGLWEDMNEASDFCEGICYAEQAVANPIKDHVPYIPASRDLEEKQMSLDAYHQNGWKQFDTHGLYGTMQARETYNWFKAMNMRAFTISRSTFAGHGKYGQKWLGDNYSSLEYLRQSVLGVMMMNVYGIPFVGSDICGFGGDTTPLLCARWYSVALFQPFTRNHNAVRQIPQEPYVFSELVYEGTLTYTQMIRTAMRTKLCLIRYYYTILHENSQYGGTPPYRPLFFDFPNQDSAYDYVPNNVLLGPSLKISHLADNLDQNQTVFYFPPGLYCNIFNPKEKCFKTNGQNKLLSSKAYEYYAHLMGGNVIPMQDAFTIKANTTVDLQNKPIDLHILGYDSQIPGLNWTAEGVYVNDDGLTIPKSGVNYNRYKFTASQYQQGAVTKIQVQIQTSHASIYDPKDGSYCSAVNKNDYLKNVYFYNADAYQSKNKFYVEALYINGTESSLSAAQYNQATDRLEFIGTKDLCLPALAILTFYRIG